MACGIIGAPRRANYHGLVKGYDERPLRPSKMG